VQFQKKLRLHEARRLNAQRGAGSGHRKLSRWYEKPVAFNREYSRSLARRPGRCDQAAPETRLTNASSAGSGGKATYATSKPPILPLMQAIVRPVVRGRSTDKSNKPNPVPSP